MHRWCYNKTQERAQNTRRGNFVQHFPTSLFLCLAVSVSVSLCYLSVQQM
jgi:hypothetical protein